MGVELSKRRHAGHRRRSAPASQQPDPEQPPAPVAFSVTEVIVYGLLATAIVAGVLYAGGRTPLQIGAAAGAIAGFVAIFAIIAPRARRPIKVERTDDAPPPAATDTPPPAPAAAPPPPEQLRKTGKRGRRRRARHAG